MSTTNARALSAAEYDLGWRDWSDFIRYNPGARHRRRQILALLRGILFNHLLDVGCGNGEMLGELRRHFPRASFTGVDLSPEVVERNRRRLPGIDFGVLDIAASALDRQFDAILCSEVVEHLEDRPRAFGHLAAMLAPGGHLLVTTPTGRMYETERRFGHTTHPTPAEIRDYAAAHGLRVVLLRNWGWPLYQALKWVTNVNPEWALRNFASGSYSPGAKLVSHALYWANFLNLPSAPGGCQLFALLRKK
ncbi:MAG: class I SAM-dependent methyltransferase [Planctomycetaceae bacterium]